MKNIDKRKEIALNLYLNGMSITQASLNAGIDERTYEIFKQILPSNEEIH